MSSNAPLPLETADEDLEGQIHSQLITLLFQQQVSSAVANVLVSAVFVALVWGEVAHQWLLAWYGFHLSMVGLRLYSRHRFQTREPVPGDTWRWGRISAVFSGLVGLSWGLCALLFITPDHPLSYIALTIIITGFAAGSVTALSPYFPAYLAHVIPSMGGLALALLMSREPFAIGIAALVTAGFAAYTPASRNVNRVLRHSARLGFENLALRNRADERTELLRTVLETMSQGVLVEDRDHRPLLWNDRLAAMIGDDVNADPKDASEVSAALSRARISIDAARSGAQEHQLDNGRVLEVVSSEMRAGGAVTTFSDVTPLVQRERAEEAARIAAEQANAAKTRFLAAASHDLRQPIHALGLFVDALALAPTDERAPRLMSHIRESLSTVDSMLNSLLDISKLDAGVVHPEPCSFDAGELAAVIVREVRQQAEAAGLELRLRRVSDSPVYTDLAMLGCILRNLVHNALRYTTAGGALVAIRARHNCVRIDVIDTGIGIPKEAHDLIFVEFQQLGNRERDRQQGLGLGLAIVSRLVRLLGIELRMRSRPGRGSCFSLRIPRSAGPARSEPVSGIACADPSADSLDSLPILVLDDDPEVLLATDLVLRQWACEVLAIGDLNGAFEILDGGWRPGLLIVDYRLPGVRNGIVAIERLRSLIGPVPALLITGDTGPEHLQRAEQSGLPVLHKPVRADQLRNQMLRLLGRQRGPE